MVEQPTSGGRSTRPAFDGDPPRPDRPAADNELVVVADCRYMRTGEGLHRFVDPVDEAVYLYTQFETADARRVFACFDQPDLKATFGFDRQRPRGLEVVSNSAAPSRQPVDGEASSWRFAHDEARCRPTSPRSSPARTHAVRDDARRHPDGPVLPPLARRAPRRRRHPRGHQAGLRLLRAAVRLPLPVRQVRPAVRAGVQRRRDGERGRGDVARRLRLPQQGHRRRVRAAGRDDPARDRPHVVRRPRHDALVGRPVAQRVVRDLRVGARQARPPAGPSAWTTFANAEKTWAYRQDQLPSTHPIAADIGDIEDVEVNFDGITYAKGAVGAQAARRLGRPGRLPRRPAQLLHRSTSTATRRSPTCSPSSRRRPAATCPAGRSEWLETAGVNTLRPQFETGADGAFTPFSRAAGGARASTRRCARTASPSASTTWSTAGCVRTERVELDVAGAKHRGARAGRPRRSPTWCWSTTTTSPTPRSGSTSGRSRTLIEHVGDFDDSLPRALCWAAAWDMTRDAEMAARDYLALVLARHRHRDRHRRRAVAAAPGAVGRRPCTPTPRGRRPAARSSPPSPTRAAARGRAGSDQQLAWARALGRSPRTASSSRCCAGLLDGSRARSRASPSTPSCAGTCCSALAVLGQADGTRSTPSSSATARPRASGTPPPPARPGRPPRPRRRRGRSPSRTTPCPTPCSPPSSAASSSPSRLDLLAPWVEPLLRGASTRSGARRTAEMAQNVVVGLYPSLLVEPVRGRPHRRLPGRAPTPPPALRRLLLEGRDGVVRALEARERDAAAG